MEEYLKRITFKKLKLDQLRPLRTHTQQSLDDWLRVELTYASNAIEGNTLTRIETAEVLEKGTAAAIGKPLRDQLEALNHAKAVDWVVRHSRGHQSHSVITQADILALHKLILAGIDDEWAGRYRRSQVFVKGSNFAFPQPQSVPYAMGEFIQWLTDAKNEHPVLLAANAHFKFVTIHPFVDGNGRTARLLMNLLLLRHGYPLAVIRSEDRTQYLDAVKAGQTNANLSPFYRFIEQTVEHSLDVWLAAAQGKAALASFASSQPTSKQKNLLRIGTLGQASGENVHTIRFWTQEGLLQTSGKTKGGYQLYRVEMIERAKRIRHLQATQRLTLAEIRSMVKRAA